MDALVSVQVTSGKDKSGFQLTFAVGKDSKLLNTLLPVGYLDPITTRVILIVSLGGFPHVLMDGVVTRHELTPSNEPGQSTLTVTGEDLSVLMDLAVVTKQVVHGKPGDGWSAGEGGMRPMDIVKVEPAGQCRGAVL